MFFKKKSKKEEIACPSCEVAIESKFSFCPHCGEDLVDPEEEMQTYGMLGRADAAPARAHQKPGFGEEVAEQLIGTLMNSMVRSLTAQFKEGNNSQVKRLPNGIQIQMGPGAKRQSPAKQQQKTITEHQVKKMASLPRTEAKANIRRLSDKIVYELAALGITSPDDVFFSKTESGYEVKAIGKTKVYVNNLPINLPLRGYAIHDKGLSVEFSLQ